MAPISLESKQNSTLRHQIEPSLTDKLSDAQTTIAIQSQEIVSLKASCTISKKTETELTNAIRNKDVRIKYLEEKFFDLKLSTIQIEEKDKLIQLQQEENLKLIQQIEKLKKKFYN